MPPFHPEPPDTAVQGNNDPVDDPDDPEMDNCGLGPMPINTEAATTEPSTWILAVKSYEEHVAAYYSEMTM